MSQISSMSCKERKVKKKDNTQTEEQKRRIHKMSSKQKF